VYLGRMGRLGAVINRYWRVTVIGLAVGFLLGVAVFGAFLVSGNPDWRADLTVVSILQQSAVYGAIGLIVALAATIGGWVCVALFDRQLQKQPSSRAALAAVGAASGTLVLGLALAVVDYASGFTSWSILLPIIFVLAIAAAVAAALLVSRAEAHSPITKSKALAKPKEAQEARWVDF
jgi:hypothetical protein